MTVTTRDNIKQVVLKLSSSAGEVIKISSMKIFIYLVFIELTRLK